jgi:hypothetical protein
MPPSSVLTGPASSGRFVCAPQPMTFLFYRRQHEQNKRPICQAWIPMLRACAWIRKDRGV